MRTRTSARPPNSRRRHDCRRKRAVLSRFQAPERITRDANLLCVAIIAHERGAGAYGIQANAKLTHGHVRPIVVEPIRRRPLETKQGRISTNSAASRISDTGGTLVPNESEPQQAGGERPLSTQAVVRTLRRMFKVARRRIRLAFPERINTRF